MKKLLLLTAISLISTWAISQGCSHFIPSTVSAIKTDITLAGSGDNVWICKDRTITVSGTDNTIYIEKGCDITVTGKDQTHVYMKAPGTLTINSDGGTYTIASDLTYTDNGNNNTINLCDAATNELEFIYDNAPAGVTDCINTTGISNSLPGEQVMLYPNPVKSILNVSVQQSPEKYNYKIYNVAGKMVLSGNMVSNPQQIDLSELNKGLYFIELQSDQNKISKRISVE